MVGTNGLTAVENLKTRQRKPLYEEPAEIEHSKCPAHPTKRMWISDVEAIREAESRTIAAKMQIAAYRCDECGNAHLCKAENARPGSVLRLPESPERNWEVFKPKPANPDAKRKVLVQFLDGRESVLTSELTELLGLGRAAVGKYMGELGWHNTRGMNARWIRTAEKKVPALKAVDKPVDKPAVRAKATPIDMAKRRHPSSQEVGWRPMTRLDPIVHMPIGDLLATLRAAGMEVRIQVREINE